MFDPLSWGLGWGLGKLGEAIIKALTPSELPRRLTKSVEDWASHLPENAQVEPSAIFARDDTQGPARLLLSQRLKDSTPPSDQEWLAALLERWEAIKAQGGDLQPLFQLTKAEASSLLASLATRLATVCLGDERIFRTTTAGVAARSQAWLQGSAVMFVTEIEEPKRYTPSYEIRFYIHNPGAESIMVYHLGADIVDVEDNTVTRTATPGAPIQEYQFRLRLHPKTGHQEMMPLGPRRFELKSRESEFFVVHVSADPGYDYLVRLTAQKRDLLSSEASQISTPELWLKFEEAP